VRVVGGGGGKVESRGRAADGADEGGGEAGEVGVEGRKVGCDGLHDGRAVSADYSVLLVRKGRGRLLLLSGGLANAEDSDEEATEADRDCGKRSEGG